MPPKRLLLKLPEYPPFPPSLKSISCRDKKKGEKLGKKLIEKLPVKKRVIFFNF